MYVFKFYIIFIFQRSWLDLTSLNRRLLFTYTVFTLPFFSLNIWPSATNVYIKQIVHGWLYTIYSILHTMDIELKLLGILRLNFMLLFYIIKVWLDRGIAWWRTHSQLFIRCQIFLLPIQHYLYFHFTSICFTVRITLHTS